MTPRPPTSPSTVPVTEEELEIGRRQVETGAVRIRKEVREEPVEVLEESVLEAVEVERVPVGRVVDAVPQVRIEGEVTVVPVVEERVVVVRELVLVEELRLTRRRETRPVRASATLRKERVTVERRDADGQWRADGGS